jgi:hypothetical protein
MLSVFAEIKRVLLRILHWPGDSFNAQCRKIDLAILWPECCEAAPDLDHAKAAFMLHASLDPAWRCLGDQALEIIDKLEDPRGHKHS